MVFEGEYQVGEWADASQSFWGIRGADSAWELRQSQEILGACGRAGANT